MSQVSTGIRKILELSKFYSLFQWVLGAEQSRALIIEHYLNIQPGMSLLDIGCGPADILEKLPTDCHYVGFDFQPSYIESAKKRYGNRGEFYCANVASHTFSQDERFDRIYVGALLHHLEDSEVESLLQSIHNLLSPGGYLIAVENVFCDEQSWLAKKIIGFDRGQNVRTAEGYTHLLQKYFSHIEYEIRHDLLRIPYTHILLRCSHEKIS